MEETKEKNRQKKEAELIAAAPKKIADMLARNGFNEEGVTYVALGDTYAIKDELKDAGFKFDAVLKWHGPAPRDYNCFALTKDEVFMFNEIGDYHYRDGLADLVQSKMNEASADKSSDYVGEVKERLRDIEVVLERKITVDTMFGLSNLYTFRMGTNVLTWFSQNVKPEDMPSRLYIFSDMEFNGCVGFGARSVNRWGGSYIRYNENNISTELERIAQKWAAAGYKLPPVVFWNLDARNDNIPALGGRFSYVSGFNMNMVETILSGKDGYDLMLEKLMSERYSVIA